MLSGPDDKEKSEYGTLLARVKEGDLSVDFQRLRFSYMDSPERRTAQDISYERAEMVRAVGAKDFKLALGLSEVVLGAAFVDIDGHLTACIANEELQQKWWSDYHKNVFGRLLDSILNQGDGQSAATAYKVISVHEEYAVLRVLGVTPVRQSLHRSDGHSYDVFAVKDARSGEDMQVFFNVDIPMANYSG
jgi:Domain of unknown function (DUF4919)